MEKMEIASELRALCKLDIDAYFAYQEALRHIEEKDIKANVERFRGDHERHIKEVSEEIRTLGEKPPEFSRDLKGYVLGVFTKVRSLTGTEGALKALKSGEETTNRKYETAVKMDFPTNVKNLIERNFQDAQKHLSWIENAINTKAWKKAA